MAKGAAASAGRRAAAAADRYATFPGARLRGRTFASHRKAKKVTRVQCYSNSKTCISCLVPTFSRTVSSYLHYFILQRATKKPLHVLIILILPRFRPTFLPIYTFKSGLKVTSTNSSLVNVVARLSF